MGFPETKKFEKTVHTNHLTYLGLGTYLYMHIVLPALITIQGYYNDEMTIYGKITCKLEITKQV